MTLAQAMASTPDALLAAVMARTVVLAQRFDDLVFCKLPASAIDANSSSWYRTLPDRGSRPPKQHPKQYPNVILTALIEGRQLLEDSGFRAPSCLIASTKYFTDLHQWVFDTTAVEPLLAAANVNSLHRATQLDKVPVGKDTVHLMLMVGRRQQIAPGCADVASPGEEPVDLAISVPPSLEVDGENTAGELELAVRVRFATRVKDQRGVVVFHPSNE